MDEEGYSSIGQIDVSSYLFLSIKFYISHKFITVLYCNSTMKYVVRIELISLKHFLLSDSNSIRHCLFFIPISKMKKKGILTFFFIFFPLVRPCLSDGWRRSSETSVWCGVGGYRRVGRPVGKTRLKRPWLRMAWPTGEGALKAEAPGGKL